MANRIAMFWDCMALVIVGLPALGCVSTRIDKNTSGERSGYPAEPRDASSDAAVTKISEGMTPLTPELRSQLTESVCVTWDALGATTPTVLELVVDVSSSMNTPAPNTANLSKWEATRSTLQSVIDRLPQSTELGMLLFPNRDTAANLGTTDIDVSNCVNTSAMVPIDQLGTTDSEQRRLIANRLKVAAPQGGSPTQDAVNLALGSDLVPAIKGLLDTRAYMVLVTDGLPTIAGGCRGQGSDTTATTYQPVIDLISQDWKENGIRTFVIGAPGSERDVESGADVRYWLSQAASAGQTQITSDCNDTGVPNFCHYDMSQVPVYSASLQRALQTIAGLVVSCNFAIPSQVDGTSVNSASLNVIYDVNDETKQQLLIGQTDASCLSGGWYLDAADHIELCPETCATVQGNPNANLHIIGGCQTLTVIN